MHPIHKAILIIVVCCIAILGYFGFTLYKTAHNIASTPKTDFEQQRLAINKALDELPISLADKQQGFWYSIKGPDGADAVGFVDPEQLARSGMTEAEIARLIAKLKLARITSRDSMTHIADDAMPPWAQFHNDLYSFSEPGDFQAREKKLESVVKSSGAKSEDFERLAYIAELKGEYARRDSLYTDSCKKFKTHCQTSDQVTLSGSVEDTQGVAVAGAKITVLGKSKASTTTDENGEYSIKIAVQRPEKIRISAVKLNFSEGIGAALASPGGSATLNVEKIELASSVGHVTIDTRNGKVIGEQVTVTKDGEFNVRTAQSLYRIPQNSIVTAAGVPYKGLVDVYLYEFNNDTVPASLTNVDTFDQVMGYAGNLMKSFGMPYIQFFTPEGQELHVLSSKPMTLRYKLANMDDLKSDAARIYGPLTEGDMDRMIDASLFARDGYPIDRAWLIENGLLRFPAFWVYDRSKGIWESIGMRVLNQDGTIEAPFYTLSKPLK